MFKGPAVSPQIVPQPKHIQSGGYLAKYFFLVVVGELLSCNMLSKYPEKL